MRIAFITYGFADISLPLLKYLSRRIEVELYLVYAQNRKRDGIIDFEGTDVGCGFLETSKVNDILGKRLLAYLDKDFNCNIFIYKNLRFKDIGNLMLSCRLSAHLLKKKYDCIHFSGNDLQQFWISFFTPNIPKIHTIHDYLGHTGERGKWAERFNRYLVATRHQKIMHSNFVIEHFDLAKHSVHRVYFGPVEVYNLWREETVKEQPSTVLFFGRISPYKGLEYLIKAEPLIARQVPDLKIIIAGEGDLSRYAAMMQNRDRYEIHNSYVSKELAAELFQRASCVVLPYIDATQSAVLMTAYAFGKPAVVTRVGGLAEIVEEAVNGLLVPPANVAALAEAVTRLLSNNVLKERMKDNIKNHLKEELSWERIAQETSAVYQQALGDRIPRA